MSYHVGTPMKLPLILRSALACSAAFLLTCAGPSAVGQENSPAPAVNVRLTYERYALPADDLAALMLGGKPGPPLRDEILRLEKEGRARLVTLQSLTTKNRHQALAEEVIEYRYPQGYSPPQDKGISLTGNARATAQGTEAPPMVPTITRSPGSVTMQGRDLGNSLVFEPNLSSGILELQADSTRLAATRREAQAPGLEFTVPTFTSLATTTQLKVSLGQPFLIDTVEPATTTGGPEAPAKRDAFITFGRLDSETITPTTGGAAQAAPHYRFLFAFYSMTPEAARDLLASHATGTALEEAIRTALDEGTAKRELLQSLPGIVAQDAKLRQGERLLYPSRYATSAAGGPPSIRPAAMEGRDLGMLLSLKPQVDAGICDLAFFPQLTRQVGQTTQAGALGEKIRQPLFSSQRVQTSSYVPVGGHAFLGTFSPPGDTGIPEADGPRRVWLGIISCQPAEK